MDLKDPTQDLIIDLPGISIPLNLRAIIKDPRAMLPGFSARLIIDTEQSESGAYVLKKFKVDWCSDPSTKKYYRYKSDSASTIEKALAHEDVWSGRYLNKYRLRPEVAQARVRSLVDSNQFSMEYQPIVDAKKSPLEQRPSKPNPPLCN